jgi:hypothetical protein
MNAFSRLGWLVTAIVLLLHVTEAFATPTTANPLEGYLLRHSSGTLYVYHAGLKFSVQVADIGDQLIDTIPTASGVEWQSWFGGTTPRSPAAPEQPAPPNS